MDFFQSMEVFKAAMAAHGMQNGMPAPQLSNTQTPGMNGSMKRPQEGDGGEATRKQMRMSVDAGRSRGQDANTSNGNKFHLDGGEYSDSEEDRKDGLGMAVGSTDKRKRNCLASARFRQKKKAEMQMLEEIATAKTEECEKLTQHVKLLQAEVHYLKQLMFMNALANAQNPGLAQVMAAANNPAMAAQAAQAAQLAALAAAALQTAGTQHQAPHTPHSTPSMPTPTLPPHPAPAPPLSMPFGFPMPGPPGQLAMPRPLGPGPMSAPMNLNFQELAASAGLQIPPGLNLNALFPTMPGAPPSGPVPDFTQMQHQMKK